MKDCVTQFDEVEDDSMDDGPGSAVVQLYPQRKAVQSVPQRDIIEKWGGDFNPKLAYFFERFEEVGLDLDPLRVRMRLEEKLDIFMVIRHMREYLAAVIRAVELRVVHNMRATHVHSQPSLSNAALSFAERFANGDVNITLEQLDALSDKLEEEEADARILDEYLKRF